MNGSFRKTGEDRRQVFAHGDVPASAGFDDGEDGGDFRSGLLAADVDPVFATDRYGRMEFSARLLLSSSSGYSRKSVSLGQSASG
jgi:hypothetical protein